MDIIEKLKGWLTEPDPGVKQSKDKDNYQKDYQRKDSLEGIDAFIVVSKPYCLAQVEQLCKDIKQGKAVLLIMEKMTPEDRQRTVDFTSGVIMAQEGTITKVYQDVYLCTSKNIGIIEE
ncbi:MAG: cell division protein SepF [Erysipelotrichaceae bacterium]|nr:cell division protein SepF [Erysipelotrichaceae bacterium]